MISAMRDLIIDARCLQDPAFARRGIGSHAAGLIAGGRARADIRTACRFVALTDPALPALTEDFHALFDDVRVVAYRHASAQTIFLQPSPMTHDPLWVARLLADPNVPSIALVYDFIPHEFPQRYLTNSVTRVRYYASLASLRLYDGLLAISEATRLQLESWVAHRALLVAVTGVALRSSMLPQSNPLPARRALGRILVPSGEDWRKNPEIAVRAHAMATALQSQAVTLEFTGLPTAETQLRLRTLSRDTGGNPDLLVFHPFLDDPSLAALYRACNVVVVPSRSEGFSIPVIEAMAQSVPVLASNCPAHAELLANADDRFDADDPADLQRRLNDLAVHPSHLDAMTARTAAIWPRFTQEQVNARAWDAIAALIDPTKSLAKPAIARHHRPRIAFVSPMPPTPSGCADFSEITLQSLVKRADISVFTNTPNPQIPPQARFAGTPGRYAHVSNQFDAVIDVIGNSHFHQNEFDLLRSHGAACIAHDARMLDFYVHRLGLARACAQASAEAGRPVSPEEVEHWLTHPGELPVLFLGEIAAASRPLFVHSAITARLITQLYQRTAIVLPFPPYRDFTDAELSEAARARVRSQLGLAREELIIASFGTISRDRALGELIWAVDMLRSWGFAARLVLIGQASPDITLMIDRLAAEVGVSVTIITDRNNQSLYRDWLIACDVAVQLRTYGFGGLSGALIDCIGAGIPSVANTSLANAIQAPPYVATIPDALSAPLLAEAIAAIIEPSRHRPRPLAARRADLANRNFDIYCTKLMNGLGFA
jgi:glycosyltransferase involved in cell wall biosynthesis